jgi:SAM-dependent methyltransferase
MATRPYYSSDLAFIHDAGYSDFAASAAPGLLATLKHAGLTRSAIVELGCGAGAVTRALVAAGHHVLGIDASPAMIRLARANVPQARFTIGRLPTAAIPPCDGVVAISEVVNYMAGRGSFVRLFRRVFRALPPGGVFVFDVREPGRPGPPVVNGRVGRNWAVLSITTEDPARGTLKRSITSFRRVGRRFRRTDETHRLTLLPAAELARRLQDAGFVVGVTREYGTFRLPPNHAVLTARKPVKG